MIKISLSTTTLREDSLVDPSKTVREFLESKSVDYSRATVLLNGASLAGSTLDKTFTALGVTDSCLLSAIVKADNA